eukprot:scpid71034/ scgid31365/ 
MVQIYVARSTCSFVLDLSGGKEYDRVDLLSVLTGAGGCVVRTVAINPRPFAAIILQLLAAEIETGRNRPDRDSSSVTPCRHNDDHHHGVHHRHYRSDYFTASAGERGLRLESPAEGRQILARS